MCKIKSHHALILAPFAEKDLQKLGQHISLQYESWTSTQRLLDPDELSIKINNEKASILIIEADFVFDETFSQSPTLQFVGICRSATNHIDVTSAIKHGVAVVNTPGRTANAVAELSLALMFALARKIPESNKYIHDGRWINPVDPYINLRGIELNGKILGIIGLGTIGKRISELGYALGMKCIAYDPYANAIPRHTSITDIDFLMKRSDFISINVPETEETKKLLDARLLELMKPTSFLINLSSPSITDEKTLVLQLKNKRIAGAAFDIYESTPINPDNPLLKLQNVILSPHLGGATEGTVDRHSSMMSNDIIRFINGKRPKNIVNPDIWHGK